LLVLLQNIFNSQTVYVSKRVFSGVMECIVCMVGIVIWLHIGGG